MMMGRATVLEMEGRVLRRGWGWGRRGRGDWHRSRSE